MGKRDKSPRTNVPAGKRQPAIAQQRAGRLKQPVESPAGAERQRNLRFRFDKVDIGGPWCLSKITPEDHQYLIQKLREFESMTVHEAFARGEEPGKDYDMSRCPNPAPVKRLGELGLTEIDGVSRLRLSGKMRLYGIRIGHEFSILWWDPEHDVWPSTRR